MILRSGFKFGDNMEKGNPCKETAENPTSFRNTEEPIDNTTNMDNQGYSSNCTIERGAMELEISLNSNNAAGETDQTTYQPTAREFQIHTASTETQPPIDFSILLNVMMSLKEGQEKLKTDLKEGQEKLKTDMKEGQEKLRADMKEGQKDVIDSLSKQINDTNGRIDSLEKRQDDHYKNLEETLSGFQHKVNGEIKVLRENIQSEITCLTQVTGHLTTTCQTLTESSAETRNRLDATETVIENLEQKHTDTQIETLEPNINNENTDLNIANTQEAPVDNCLVDVLDEFDEDSRNRVKETEDVSEVLVTELILIQRKLAEIRSGDLVRSAYKPKVSLMGSETKDSQYIRFLQAKVSAVTLGWTRAFLGKQNSNLDPCTQVVGAFCEMPGASPNNNNEPVFGCELANLCRNKTAVPSVKAIVWKEMLLSTEWGGRIRGVKGYFCYGKCKLKILLSTECGGRIRDVVGYFLYGKWKLIRSSSVCLQYCRKFILARKTRGKIKGICN